jgi:hypothetical protein
MAGMGRLAVIPSLWGEGRIVADNHALNGIELARDACGYAIQHIVCLFPKPEGNVAVISMLDVDGRETACLEQLRRIKRVFRPHPYTPTDPFLRGRLVAFRWCHITSVCGKRTVRNWAAANRQLEPIVDAKLLIFASQTARIRGKLPTHSMMH